MTIILKHVFNLIKMLNSETGSVQISLGCALGFILGMTPVLSLHSLLVFACLFLFRIQFGAAMLSAFVFAFPAFLLDPLFHRVGAYFLELPSLQELWTALYNMPIIPFTRFNNSIVLGSGIVSIVLAPLVFFLALFLVSKYREKVVARFKDSKLFKALKATSIYKWYAKYQEFYG